MENDFFTKNRVKTALWEGVAEEALGPGHIFCTQMWIKDGNKTGLITYLTRFGERGYSNLRANTPGGCAL